MNAPLPTLDGDAVKSLLLEVAEVLRERNQCSSIVIAGGSLLAWLDLRDSTRDIDSVRSLDSNTKHAAMTVAQRHGMAVTWLNDAAAAYWPSTLDIDDCDLLMDHPNLTVRAVPLQHLLLMKLHRANPADLDDIRRIWPFAADDYDTAHQIVDAYHAAFPLAPPDEYLASFVVDQLELGGHRLPLC
jgi:hypothetical protein